MTTSAALVISARMLVMQSKRLMLSSVERRQAQASGDELRQRVDRLRDEVATAQDAHRRAVLDFGSPQNAEYWLAVYANLIERAGTLLATLRATVDGLPANERLEVSVDVEVVEDMLERWRGSMREAIAQAVA